MSGLWGLRRCHGALLRSIIVLSLLVAPSAGAAAGVAFAARDTNAQAGLAPFRAPDGGTIQVDPGLAQGLAVLAGLDVGPALVNNLARGNIRVDFGDPENAWAYYQGSQRLIRISDVLRGADPRVLAALLAHEAQHALSDSDGTAAQEAKTLGEEAACVQDEHRATVTELRVWYTLFGPQGKQPELNAYEEHVNEQLEEYLESPTAFRHSAPTAHASSCLD